MNVVNKQLLRGTLLQPQPQRWGAACLPAGFWGHLRPQDGAVPPPVSPSQPPRQPAPASKASTAAARTPRAAVAPGDLPAPHRGAPRRGAPRPPPAGRAEEPRWASLAPGKRGIGAPGDARGASSREAGPRGAARGGCGSRDDAPAAPRPLEAVLPVPRPRSDAGSVFGLLGACHEARALCSELRYRPWRLKTGTKYSNGANASKCWWVRRASENKPGQAPKAAQPWGSADSRRLVCHLLLLTATFPCPGCGGCPPCPAAVASAALSRSRLAHSHATRSQPQSKDGKTRPRCSAAHGQLRGRCWARVVVVLPYKGLAR